MKTTIFLVLLLFSFPSYAQKSNPEQPPKRPPKSHYSKDPACVSLVGENLYITEWFFGEKFDNKDGTFRYNPTDRIPLILDHHMGFRVTIDGTQKKPVEWMYEYELPHPFPGWDKIVKSPWVTFSPDMKMAYVKGVANRLPAVLDEFWFFIPSDKKGMYRMTLYVEGNKACNFVFDIY